MNILHRRPVRLLLSVGLSATLIALLVVTIHLTRYDLQWLAFLGGVLFAAVVALVSQASKAEWLLLRRTKQLERAREQLARESARNRSTALDLHAAETRIALLTDHLPLPVLYLDREERCRYHNRACTDWLKLGPDRVDGQPLKSLLDAKTYSLMARSVKTASPGRIEDYEVEWPIRGDGIVRVKVRQIPDSPDGNEVNGVYLIFTRPGAERLVTEQGPAPAGGARLEPDDDRDSFYLHTVTEELMAEADPRARLRHALEHGGFLLYAQKILPLKSGLPEPECYEALLRLKEEEDHLLPPGGFIPVAERYGMLEELDRWVVRSLIARSCGKRAALPGWRIPLWCVNLSAASLASTGYTAFVREEVERSDFPWRALCFEINEADAILHNEELRRFIAEVRPLGCRIGIDAFGGTRVSFSYLRGITVDFLKIDGSIVRNIARDPSEHAKARAIHAVCRKAQTRTIAECVETGETLGRLREIGIDYAQGFGIARPAPIETTLA